MGRVTRAHSNPYTKPTNLESHLASLENLIATIRDSDLPLESKKRMLNHALWEISIARGNFVPEFRSNSVLMGAKGTKIQRDHVFKRKQLVQDVLSQRERLGMILGRVIHCVVTEDEHARLTNVPDSIDGWERYRFAKIEVPNMPDA